MLHYKIIWKESAFKELQKIDSVFIPKIIKAVESLSENPFPPQFEKAFWFRTCLSNKNWFL